MDGNDPRVMRFDVIPSGAMAMRLLTGRYSPLAVRCSARTRIRAISQSRKHFVKPVKAAHGLIAWSCKGVSAWSQFTVLSNIQFNDPFVYRIEGIRAGSALVPHIARTEKFDITTNKKAKTLSQWLSGAFTLLFGESSELLADIETIYRTQTFERSSLLTEIRGSRPPGTPVFKSAGLSIKSQNDLDQLAKVASSQILEWLSDNNIPMHPLRNDPRYLGEIRFRIAIYSVLGSADGVPILTFDDVVLPLSKMKL